MRRLAVVGVLVLMLAMLGGPAFAQLGEGSVLPEQTEREALPVSAPRSSTNVKTTTKVKVARSAAQRSSSALADTGFELADGVLLAGGLLVAGGAALAVGRRRSAR